MSYNKHIWIAPEGDNLNRFIKANETADSVELIQNPSFTNVPTPFSSEWMNEIEDGIEAAHEQLDVIEEKISERYGHVEMLLWQPSVYELAELRYLPLQGQVVTIATYQRLCDRMYVGDEKNATADWWYKISNPNDKESRSTSGEYMVVLDAQAMFLRGAGKNSKYKAADNTPYDGNSLGSVNKHRTEMHTHKIQLGYDSAVGHYHGTSPTIVYLPGAIGGTIVYATRSTYANEEGIRDANETAPVWLAVLCVITF